MQQKNENHNPHIVGYGTYIFVWLSLLTLTAVTVTVAGINFGGITLLIAIVIAIVKSSLVLNFFMHIKFDDVVFKVFVGIAVLTLTAVFVFTFFDYLSR
ncbi:MAG: cytochrome C oxidase subunit IV family protein [Clostridiales bacterium]